MSNPEAGGRAAGTTRRSFVAGAAAAAGAMTVDWRSNRAFAAANARVIGANDRIRIGFIGVGGMGGGHLGSFINMMKAGELNIEVSAVCDVWQKRKDAALKRVVDGGNANGKVYHDYREMLASPDIDAVLIATPEQWHHRMALDALEAGKHIYLEKPFTRYLDEAKELHAACLAKPQIIVQTGNQASSIPKFHRAHELVETIGHPVWCQTSYVRNNPDGEWNYPIDESATPDNLDWKAWLGPAQDREFSLERYFRWRKYWDYSSGICGDLFPHKIYPLMITLGAELPTRVVAAGGNWVQKEDREVPDTFHLLADFPSGYTMFVAGTTVNDRGVETLVRGHKGDMFLEGSDIEIKPQRPYAEEFDGVTEKVEQAGNEHDAHRRNWIECMRSGQQPNCHPDLAFAGMVVCSLAETSYRESKSVRFNPETLEVIA